MELICRWCAQPLSFEASRGWTHPEGGLYMMRCDRCGWRGAPYPSPTHCPQCGGEAMDDHCALPVCLSDLQDLPRRQR